MEKTEPSGTGQERGSVLVVVRFIEGVLNKRMNIGEIAARVWMPISERNACGDFAIAWKEPSVRKFRRYSILIQKE